MPLPETTFADFDSSSRRFHAPEIPSITACDSAWLIRAGSPLVRFESPNCWAKLGPTKPLVVEESPPFNGNCQISAILNDPPSFIIPLGSINNNTYTKNSNNLHRVDSVAADSKPGERCLKLLGLWSLIALLCWFSVLYKINNFFQIFWILFLKLKIIIFLFLFLFFHLGSYGVY